MGKTPDFDFRESDKNLIINGDMRVDQRFAGAAISSGALGTLAYTVDRWFFSSSQAGKFNAGQNQLGFSLPSGFQKYFNLNSITAYTLLAADYFAFLQRIEGFNIAHLAWGTVNAKPVVLSFWVQSSVVGTHSGSVANDAVDRTYPFVYTINTPNVFEFKEITIPGDVTGVWTTNNTTGIIVKFGLGVGSTFSAPAGAWVAGNFVSANGAVNIASANGANWNITGVQLNEGRVAAPFERRSFGDELRLCQRYYSKSYPAGVAAGTFPFLSGAWSGASDSGTSAYHLGTMPFPVEMRASPTMTFYNPNDGNTTNPIWDGATNRAFSNYSLSQRAFSGHVSVNTGAGQTIYLNWAANAEL